MSIPRSVKVCLAAFGLIVCTAVPASASPVVVYTADRLAGYAKYVRSTDTFSTFDQYPDGYAVVGHLSGTRPNGNQDSWDVIASGSGTSSDYVNAPLKPGTLASIEVCRRKDMVKSMCVIETFTA